MYALKARDKLHKREKDLDKEMARGAESRAREVDRHHRGDKKKPATSKREAKYIGTFSIEMGPSWKKDMGKTVKQQLARINTKHPSSCQLPVSIMINMEGVKVISADGNDLIMAHAVKRIIFCTADAKKHLFVFVAKNPESGPEGVYSHVFLTAKKEQASELSEIVGKAFKATFAKQTLTRDKKKKKEKSGGTGGGSSSSSSGSSSPWTVVNHSQPSSSGSTGATSSENSAPSPSAPPVQRQPWTVQNHPQPTNPTYLAPSSTHSHSTSPAASLQGRTHDQLLDEAGRLESEVGQLRSRVGEIEEQMRELASFPDAVVQLTEQLSIQQHKLDEKRQRLSLIHERLQQMAVSSPSGGVQPPAYPGTPSGFSGNRLSASDDLLPDFESLSLEDAEWFQAGLPRELAMEILSQQPEGSFIVRNSSSNPGSFALSVKGPQDRITHYLIDRHGNEFKLQGSGMSFPSMMDLIYHHCFERGPLPCTLNLGVANPSFLDGGGVGGGLGGSDSDNDDDFMAGVGLPPYHLLT